MIRKVILSPRTLYFADNTIFQYFKVPGEMKKDEVVDSILLATIEMSTIYTSPSTFKNMVKIWTDKNFPIWERLYETLFYDYNPIHNYDRTEESTDILDGKHVRTDALHEKAVLEKTDKTDYDYESNVGNKVAAFNNGLAESTAGNDKGESHTTLKTNSENNVDNTGTVTNKSDDTNTHTMRAYGNIGVTTTQKMIQEQRELVKFNIVDYIVDDFKMNLCVMIY